MAWCLVKHRDDFTFTFTLTISDRKWNEWVTIRTVVSETERSIVRVRTLKWENTKMTEKGKVTGVPNLLNEHHVMKACWEVEV
jgi:hypothetical protein